MLIQWRYKIVQRFARNDGELIFSQNLKKLYRLKPRPTGLFLYKPSSRRYDYVDYTGRVKGTQVEVDEMTAYLEMLGYIKFIEEIECNGEFFK